MNHNFNLPKPPGINALYKITCRNGYPTMYKSAEGKAWLEEAGYAIKRQFKGKLIVSDVSLYVQVFYFKQFDIDSCLKPLLDLFQTMQIIKNDSQVVFLQVEKIKVDKKEKEKVIVELTK